MKTIKLSHDLEAKVDDEDYEALKDISWSAYRIAGTSHTGKVYLYGYKPGRKEGGKKIWLYNVIMNPSEGMFVDHIDGDPLNNVRQNLRLVTRKQNNMNRGKRSNGLTSQYLGVCFDKQKKKFKCSVKYEGKSHHLGYFTSEAAAALAYNDRAAQLFGEHARLNKLDTAVQLG